MPTEFQQITDQILDGLLNTFTFVDNSIVMEGTKADHWEKITKV